jgi:hypothetical protein
MNTVGGQAFLRRQPQGGGVPVRLSRPDGDQLVRDFTEIAISTALSE